MAIPDFKATLRSQREQRPWLDHLIRAAGRFNTQRGDFYAAAITYFTVLSIFPLLMIAFAIAGFVLAGDASLLQEVRDKIAENAPGSMGDQLKDLIDQAISSRTSVGVIGLLGGLYAGLGWMGNLRSALTEQWDQKHKAANMVVQKLGDLVALLGLLVALAVSFGLSALSAAGVTKPVLKLVNLEDAPGVSIVLKLASIALAIFASWAVFVWVIARLPREPVTFKSAARAALLAAVVFEIFKQFAAFYLKIVLTSPAGAIFGPIIGLMVFSFFLWRILLFATAWAATSDENMALAFKPPPESAVITPRYEVRTGPSAKESAALVGAGMLAVLGLSAWRQRKDQ